MFFAYGQETETTNHYLREAFVSARRIKALNPSVNITLVTNPAVTLDITGAFDLVRMYGSMADAYSATCS